MNPPLWASPRPETEDRRQALEEIRTQVGQLRDELVEIGEAEVSIEAELRRLELEYRLQSQMVAEAVAERQLAEDAVKRSNERVEALAERLAATRKRLSEHVRALYRAAPSDWLRGFVEVRQPGDLFLYLRTVGLLARRDAALLPSFLAEQEQLETERKRLEENRSEVTRAAAREGRRLAQLQRARRKQALVVAALERERERLRNEADNLDDKERKLALLITVLSESPAVRESGASIQGFRGVLDWPIEGDVSIPFGPRYEARYGTSVPHNGIRLEPRSDRVLSVFRGEVIFAARFEGFGRTVVVHHPSRVFSLYAGLDDLEVAKGDIVELGQVLGRTGSALYFEIRVENRPEDPLDWLR